jgi:hypothetical protein
MSDLLYYPAAPSRACITRRSKPIRASTGSTSVSNLFGSDQASETYNFLGQSPMMREWIGRRQAKGFNGNGITIINKHYEATIEIAKKDARRDKTGQIRAHRRVSPTRADALGEPGLDADPQRRRRRSATTGSISSTPTTPRARTRPTSRIRSRSRCRPAGGAEPRHLDRAARSRKCSRRSSRASCRSRVQG